MPNPLTVGLRATARLEEAILLALEEYRDQGYLSTIRLAERICPASTIFADLSSISFAD